MDSTTPSPIKPGRKHKHGQVLVVGSGDCGQLGLGNSIFSASKPKLLSYFNDKSIYNVFAGGLHNIALSTSGSLYSWGCNDLFALGRSKSKPEDEPLPVEGLDNIVIVQVACGDSISCALDDKGYVYNWGTFRNNSGVFGVLDGKSDPESGDQAMVIPARVMQLKNIIKIAAGSNHLVALSSDGKVYTWGTGEQGIYFLMQVNWEEKLFQDIHIKHR